MPPYKTFDVIPDDGVWLLRTAGEPRIPRRHHEKQEAIQEAVRLALEDRPSQVVVHSGRGRASQCVIFDVQNRDIEAVEPDPIECWPSPADGGTSEVALLNPS